MVKYEDIIQILIETKVIKNQVNDIQSNATLEEIGLDSLDIMMVLFEINKKYNLDIKATKKDSIEILLKKINH